MIVRFDSKLSYNGLLMGRFFISELDLTAI